MSHTQQIPSSEIHWEHMWFWGHRMGTPEDDNQRRWWGVMYGGFPSQDAADNYPDTEPVTPGYDIRVQGQLVDDFFWDEGLEEYTQTEAQVGACLHWLFTSNPTQLELDRTKGMKEARKAMAGTTLFGAFVVTELPAERTPEEDE